jgi:hypothetical protein
MTLSQLFISENLTEMNNYVNGFQRAFVDKIANISGISPLRVSDTIMV